MQLKCKAYNRKSGNSPSNSPISTATPAFPGYLPFLAKFLVPPLSDSIFGRSYPPPFISVGGVQLCYHKVTTMVWYKFQTDDSPAKQEIKNVFLAFFSNPI